MQYYLSIKNNDLLVSIEKVNNNGEENTKLTINVNDYLIQTQDLSINLILTSFVERFNYITEELMQSPLTACEIILTSNLSFNKRIPLSEIKTSYSVNLSSNEEEIRKQIKQKLNNDKITVYYCDTKRDIYEALMYHFSINGYYLRQCKSCGHCYFRNDKRGFYCDKCSSEITQNKKNVNAKKRLKDPIENTIHKIQSRLNSRTKQKKYTKDIFKKELLEQRKKLKENIITRKEFCNWVYSVDEKSK